MDSAQSWQEGLRRLDAQLADGRLTKQQYATKREELLAEASSAPSPPPVRPKQPEPEAPKADEDPGPTETKIQPKGTVPARDLLTTSRQTTAPSPADNQPTQVLPRVSLPKTEPAGKKDLRVATAPLPAPPTGQGVPGVPPARQHNGNKRKGALPTALFLSLGVLLALGLIGGGLWWLTRDGEPASSTASPPSATTPSAPQSAEKLIDRLPRLPGVLNRNSGTVSVTDGADRKLYGADEAQVLRNAGVRTVTWKGSSRQSGDGAMAYVVLVAENETASDAKATEKALRKLSRSRVSPADPVDGHDGLPTFKRLGEESNTYRVLYTSERYTVRVGINQAPGDDEGQVKEQLSSVLTGVTKVLPPDES